MHRRVTNAGLIRTVITRHMGAVWCQLIMRTSQTREIS